jgi:hypothetical protein
MKRSQYTVYISSEHKLKLKIMAAHQNITMGAMVEQIINKLWGDFDATVYTSLRIEAEERSKVSY